MSKKAAILLGLGAGIGTGLFIKSNAKDDQSCPICLAKKALASLQLHKDSTKKYDNGVALTPPMGWSSWNTFRNTIDEELILETANAIDKTGLKDAGYTYINLDDCWQSSLRTNEGKLQGDLTRFPNGIKPLIEKINKLGLKVGLYTSNGTLTCEDLPASLYNEAIDADTLAEWGVEYFKYDFCHNEAIPTSSPAIIKLCIGKENEKDFYEEKATKGALLDGARVFNDSDVDGGAVVGGLSAGMGSLAFNNVNVPEDGKYTATIVYRKGGMKRKFLVLRVNGEKEYDCYFPASKGWTADGRLQVVVDLKKGNNTICLLNPIGSKYDSSRRQYINMGRELKRATKEYAEKNNVPEKPICFSICEWGLAKPWKWGYEAGNLWRTTPDIKPFWASMLGIYEFNVRLYKHTQKGSWNDPDMLEVGVGSLSMEENRTHFSLWCMMASPLILGNDVRKFLKSDGTVDEDNKVLQILKNKELISIDQDKRGIQAKRIYTNGFTDILVKPLENKELAVCFLNKTKEAKEMALSLVKIHNETFVDLPIAKEYEVKDLWDGTTLNLKDNIKGLVQAHGVKVYKVKAI